MTSNIQSGISLQGLSLSVFLGWPKKERLHKQKIMLDIYITFKNPPLACVSDELEDTYCYDTLVKQIKKDILPKKFRLLEHLGHQIYQVVKSAISAEAKISVKVFKKPKIPSLKQGVSFYYSDAL